MATPEHWSDSFAASIPETFYTANETLCTVGDLKSGEEVLIHAGGSGVGSTAIQMAVLMGARVATTASSDSKLARCAKLGADLCINYKQQDFVAECLRWSNGSGPNLVLDFIGGAYLERHLEVLRPQGRLVVIGLLGGASAPLNLSLLLRKRIQIKGSVMRSLLFADKLAIKARFLEKWLPSLLNKSIEPIICEEFPLANVRDAHEVMEQSTHFGKLILNFV